ncbi:MAG: glycosyltransferase, partial [Shewanella sp.]
LLSSDFEGFGLVIVESLICNTPVVSTNCPHGPNEILTGELAKFLVPVRQPALLAQKALECLASPPSLDSLAILDVVNSKYIAKQYFELT